jgi:hypothetical protein
MYRTILACQLPSTLVVSLDGGCAVEVSGLPVMAANLVAPFAAPMWRKDFTSSHPAKVNGPVLLPSRLDISSSCIRGRATPTPSAAVRPRRRQRPYLQIRPHPPPSLSPQAPCRRAGRCDRGQVPTVGNRTQLLRVVSWEDQSGGAK